MSERGFAEDFGGKRAIVWEVESDTHFEGDMNLPGGIVTFQQGMYQADQYWRGEPLSGDPSWEIVMELPVEITQKVIELTPDTLES